MLFEHCMHAHNFTTIGSFMPTYGMCIAAPYMYAFMIIIILHIVVHAVYILSVHVYYITHKYV